MNFKTVFVTLFYLSTLLYSETEKRDVMINGSKAKVWASSELKGKTAGQYSVSNLFDKDLKTAWVEGSDGNGQNEWCKILFENEEIAKGIVINPGYQKNINTFTSNNCPSKIEIIINDNEKMIVDLPYHFEEGDMVFDKNMGVDVFSVRQSNHGYNLLPVYLTFEKSIPIKSVSFRMLDVLKGLKYNDMCISEMSFINDDHQVCSILKYNGTVGVVSENKLRTLVGNASTHIKYDKDKLASLLNNNVEKVSSETQQFSNSFLKYLNAGNAFRLQINNGSIVLNVLEYETGDDNEPFDLLAKYQFIMSNGNNTLNYHSTKFEILPSAIP